MIPRGRLGDAWGGAIRGNRRASFTAFAAASSLAPSASASPSAARAAIGSLSPSSSCASIGSASSSAPRTAVCSTGSSGKTSLLPSSSASWGRRRAMVSSIVFFLSSHSHTTWTRQPISSSCACVRSSRSTFRSNLSTQYSTLVLGTRGWQRGQRCQKHPLMNRATRLPGQATSGCPGTFHWRRYPVSPAARRRARTSSSGLVSQRLLPCMDFLTASLVMRHMIALRRTVGRMDALRPFGVDRRFIGASLKPHVKPRFAAHV